VSLVKEYIELHFITVLWGFTAVLGLLIEIPVVEMVFYRTLVAAIGLLLLVYYRGFGFNIGTMAILKISGTGLIFTAHWILFFASARESNASVSLIGYATTTFWISLLEPMVTKSRFRGFEVLIGLVVIGGIYIISQAEFNYLFGLSLGIGSAILAAIFTVLNKNFIKKYNPFVITFYEMVGACLATALFFPFYLKWISESGTLDLSPSLLDWFYITILALVCTLYAYSIYVKLMKKLSAYAVSLVVNLEPVYGILLAVLIFGESEKMGGGFYLGSAIIVGAVLSYPMINKRINRKSLEIENVR
jgi:drug/metabolite transporter (DMT)-like permease